MCRNGERKDYIMKKFLCLLLTFILLLTCAPALAEGVTLLSSPDMQEPEYTGALDDLKIGVGIDLGDRIYTPVKGGFYDGYRGMDGSGSQAEYLLLFVDVLNLAALKQSFFKEAQVVVTYTNQRGEYKYGGFVRQSYTNDDYYNKGQKDFWDIDPLYTANYVFGCALPNFVVNTAGRIVMEITIGDTVMTWVYRAE